MIMLKPNGAPLSRKLVSRFAVYLLVVLLGVVWMQPLSYAEPIEDLEVEGVAEHSGTPVIHKISHRTEGDMDIFTFYYRGDLPETTVETATDGLWVTVRGCEVDLPPGSGDEFSTPVQGELIGRLDVFIEDDPVILRVGLISSTGVHFNHDINTLGEGAFEISCFKTDQLPAGDIEPPVPVVEELAPEEPSQPEVVEVPIPSAPEITRIVKVRYDPVGDVDRFTFTIEGPIPEVEVFSLQYPDRLKVNISPAEVDLPAHSNDRFETPVPGIGINKMSAVNSELNNSTIAGFTLSVDPSRTIEDLEVKVDSSLPDKIIVDVYNLQVSIPELVAEIPAEVIEAPAIEEPAPVAEEPVVEIEEPAPAVELVEVEPVVEVAVETEIEIPAVPEPVPAFEVETTEIELEPVVEPEKPMALGVNVMSGNNDDFIIQVEGDKPFDKPSLKKLGYPTRIGLTFPYADVEFRGDDSGSWEVGEGPVAKLRALEYIGDEENLTSLFVYLADNIDPDRITTEVHPTGASSYDVFISVLPEVELPIYAAEAPVITPEEPVIVEPVPEPAPIVEPEPIPEPVEVIVEPVEIVVEPVEIVMEPVEIVMEPVEIVMEPVEEGINIQIESSPILTVSPPFIPPTEPEAVEEIAEPVPVEPIEPAVEEEPAAGTIEMIEPMVEEESQPLSLYPKFTVDCIQSEAGKDRFVFEFDGTAKKPEVKRFNHPPRVMLIFMDVEPDSNLTSPYDYNKVDGAVVNRYKVTCSEDSESVKSIIEIDTPMMDSPEDIGVEFDVQGDCLYVDVFSRAVPEDMTPAPATPVIPDPVAEEIIPPLPATPMYVASLDLNDAEDEAREPDESDEELPGSEPYVQQFNVKDANIVDVLQIICIEAGISNFIDPSVTGRVSLALQEPMPLSNLLELLGDQSGFSYYVKEGVYIFASERVLEEKFPEFYDTYIIEMSYADPNQVRTILSNQGIIASDNIVVYNPSSIGQSGLAMFTTMRMLIIRGSDRDVKLALNIIKTLDQPPVQILYDVKIIQTSANIRETSGVAWLTNTTTAENIGAISFSLEEYQEVEPGEMIPQGFIRDTYKFSATMNYLNQHGKAKLLANPTISALNGQTATYFVGQDIPYRSTFQVSDIGRVTQRVANSQVGITLNITGYAASNDTVTMYIAPSVSNLLELTDIGPRTSQNNFATSMRVGDGETFIIAGLINEEERISNNKVPILGDLPLFGSLFKNKKTDIDRSELIVTITPHIIKPNEYKGPKVRRASEYEDIFAGRY